MTTANPSQILRKARELISDPERWTKGAFARNAQGASVSYRHDAATCFCSVGAVERAAFKDGVDDNQPISVALRALYRGKLYAIPSIAAFNDRDDTTHGDVLAMFDRAIALAEDEEA